MSGRVEGTLPVSSRGTARARGGSRTRSVLIAWLIGMVGLWAACRPTDDVGTAEEPGSGTASQSEPQTPSPPASGAPNGEVARHMGEHFWQLASAHDAAIQGEVEGIRAAGRFLAEHPAPEGLPEVAAAYLPAFRSASLGMAEAEHLAAGTAALGRTAAACGACHQGSGVPLPTVVDEDLDRETEPEGPMSAHIRAADLMWDGLIAPSYQAWRAGATLMTRVRVDPESLTREGTGTETAIELLTRLQEGAANALGGDARDRPRVFGEILSTCGACHTALGRGFEPDADPGPGHGPEGP